jgi:beta-N-acetylhexosaminidase
MRHSARHRRPAVRAAAPRRLTRRWLAAAALPAVLLLLGLLITQHQEHQAPQNRTSAPLSGHGNHSTPGRDTSAPSCAQQVDAMSVRDRLAQRLMVGIDPSDPDSAISVVRTTHVGGIFIGGTSTRILIGNYLHTLQEVAHIPVAVAVDDEGGRVQRINNLDGSIPSARTMAESLSPEQVRQLGYERGHALRAHGITIDFAPVADVSNQPINAVIGDRSFSPDPNTTTTYAGAYATGLRNAGILPVLKHFPGHGRASGDSHRGAVTTPPLDALRKIDLVPYQHLLNSGPTGVMVGHLDVPGLTNGLPASLSPATYQLLRTDLGFQGLTITDDLAAMHSITDRYDLPDAVLTALQAGADMALWTSTQRLNEILNRLEAAVQQHQMPIADLDRAVRRILTAKGICATSPQ